MNLDTAKTGVARHADEFVMANVFDTTTPGFDGMREILGLRLECKADHLTIYDPAELAEMHADGLVAPE